MRASNSTAPTRQTATSKAQVVQVSSLSISESQSKVISCVESHRQTWSILRIPRNCGAFVFLPASRAKLRGAPVPKSLWFMTHDGCSLRRTRGRGSGGPPGPREGSQQKFKTREMWLLQSVSALDWSISPIFHFGVT